MLHTNMEDLWDKKLDLSCLTFLDKSINCQLFFTVNAGFKETKVDKILTIHYSKDPRNLMFLSYESFSSNSVKRCHNINNLFNRIY